ncbi:hypothetical protein PR048_011310 [Dryococelus australis]|uniref:Uncharacterized protein n=1 Tax=Dryococelus australis TaxID=614101 RepID=A0ABQ9HLT4_9NEOP|nr:hypothetical protein PR048_011310 [Dryococelus australis]
MNAFKITGIWPINIRVFLDCDFLPDVASNIPLPPQTEALTSYAQPEGSPSTSLAQPDLRVSTLESVSETDPEVTVFACLSTKDASQFPQIAKYKKLDNRLRVKTTIITSTPYKEELQSMEQQIRPTIKAKRKILFSKNASSKLTQNTQNSEKEEENAQCLCYEIGGQYQMKAGQCVHDSCAGVGERQ